MNKPAGATTACFYPELTERSLELLGLAGFKTVELFFNAHRELLPEFVGKLREIADSFEMRIVSVHPYTSGYEPGMLFSGYRRRFLDALEFYKKYCDAANELGANIIVIHGDTHRIIQDGEYFERFSQLVRVGRDQGIIIAQENVNKYRSQDPEFLRAFRQNLGDEAHFVYDVKQSVRAGYTPWQVLDAMKGRIVHVHVSDHTREADCVLPGQIGGQMDFSRLKSELDNSGCTGEWIIEVYRNAFSDPAQITKAANYLNSTAGL